MKELKCSSGRLHGVLENGHIEIACRSSRCGKRPGVVVIHRFDLSTGECVSTRQYQEARLTKGVEDGSSIEGTSLRSA